MVERAPCLDDLTVPPPAAGPADWNPEGVAVRRELFDPGDERLLAYEDEWRLHNGFDGIALGDPPILAAEQPHGWRDACPYMRHEALRELLCSPEIAELLEGLIGEPAGLHLALTGWVSTERDWHQDSYLNEPGVGDSYAAVWLSLGAVHPGSGPFQYVPGSHRWGQVTREKMGGHLDLSDPMWPKHSERILSPMFTELIEREGAPVVTYTPRRGDVLAWHGRLLHRGSRPEAPNAFRPGLIAHYSGIFHRPTMPEPARHAAGGWYFPIESWVPAR